MRFLAAVTVVCVLAASGVAMAEPPAPGAASPDHVLALHTDRVPGAGRDAVTIRDPLEDEARSQRKKNAFLYIVAAGLAAIGTTYTLTRKYVDEEEE